MSCAVPEGFIEKVAAIPVGSVEFINWSGCGLIDFLVLVDPESSPNRGG